MGLAAVASGLLGLVLLLVFLSQHGWDLGLAGLALGVLGCLMGGVGPLQISKARRREGA